MSEKYISLDKALAIFNDIHPLDYNAQAYRSQLSKIPVADVRPVVRGEWISSTVINGRLFKVPHCSVCEGVPCGVDENTRFCPNCGADMRGTDNG